jgi:hypothetical protein
MDALIRLASHANADWCDAVCRAGGVPTRFDADAWIAASRTPPRYPDAVTLSPLVVADRLLARVDSGPGCSVKDSFTELDLAPAGFEVLFDATWLHRHPAPDTAVDPLGWRVVRTAGELAAWAGAADAGDALQPALLDDPAVAVLAVWSGDAVIAGAVANRSRSAVGLSWVFTTTADPDLVWRSVTTAVYAPFPGLPVVGYERGEALAAARRAGYDAIGDLRVWHRP